MGLIPWRITISIALLCVPAYFVYLKASRWLSRRTLIRRHGCEEPSRLNFDLAYMNKKATEEHNLLEITTRLFTEYGKTFKATRGGRIFIRTCDPEVFKAVLSTHFEHFGMQPIRYEGGKGFFGNGMLVTDGLQWKNSRAFIRPAFDIAHIVNFDRLSSHVERFMQLLPRDGSTVDLFPLLKRLTLDISSEFIFGRSMNALSSPDACKDFMNAFMAGQRDAVIPVSERMKDYDEQCRKVLDYIDNCIDEAFTRVADSGEKGQDAKRVRVVDELVKATQDKYSLKYLILSIFSPAHDTVAVTISNAFFHLARKPDCWAKLRAEILPSASQNLTYELLNSFKYLNWVLRETHRVTPLNSGTVRECLSTVVLPFGGGADGQSPLLVEKGDLIETNFRASHRDKSFWGGDADEFIPERWATVRPTWEYTPFSGGPRICPAFRLVYTECEYIMVTVIREFARLENRDEVLAWVEDRRLTFQSLNGAKVGLVL